MTSVNCQTAAAVNSAARIRVLRKRTYVTFRRPRVAAVKMIRGPRFLASFAATIRHLPIGEDRSRIQYLYRFSTRPRALQFVLDPIVRGVFHRETRRRLRALNDFFRRPQNMG